MTLVDYIHRSRRRPRNLKAAGSGWFFGRLSGRYSICPKSRLEIGEDCKGRHARFTLVNSRVTIGDGCRLGQISVYAINSEIHIGDRVNIHGNVSLHSPEESRIYIGDDCLIAPGVRLATSDDHSILDLMGERLNYARPVVIGNHVWIGSEVLILKGSTIGDGSVIGARALVAGRIPANVVAAGNPARVVRENVGWNYNLI